MAREWKKNACPYCSLNCALDILVEDNHIIDVRPNKDSKKEPGGYCCRKGRSIKHMVDSPERVEHPLKRVGDHFEQISWEQAISEIGEKAKAIYDKHGPKAFALCGFATASSAEPAVALTGFKNATGIQYKYSAVGFEFMGLYWSLGRILGNQTMYPEPDDKNVDVIIYWGANSYVANHFVPAHRKYIREMSENEDKMVIVVDPRLSETARMADMHIMPRNGSDVLFIRGLIAMILDKGLEDKDFLDKYCSDWDKASEWFKNFDYKKAFEVVHVPYEQAEEFVNILTTKTWGCHAELGMICGKNNTMNSYMLLMLMAITGNFLVKGNVIIDGMMRGGPGPDERDPNVWRLEETGMFPVLGTYPIGAFAKECLSKKETRHRVAFVNRSDPARSYTNSPEMEQALEALELLVVIEVAMSETARHADYVLPGKTGVEGYDFSFFPLTYPEVVWLMRHPAIGQVGERKGDSEILIEIARAMGLIPEVPAEIMEAAVKSCVEKDLPAFMMKFQPWLGQHPEYAKSMVLLLIDIFSKPECLGSVSRASARVIVSVDNMPNLGIPQRGGFEGKPEYRKFKDIEGMKTLYNMAVMDEVFWAADADPNGIVVGYSDPDPDTRAKSHIFYDDHKFQLFNDVIDDNIKAFTPELVEKELSLDDNFDMVISSGNHQDSGVDNYMINPDTYVFRKPYKLFMNPEDARDKGIAEGEMVRIVTAAGEMTAPVEYTYRANRGYAMVPHHFGHYSSRYGTYGESANDITNFDNLDKITGDPEIRYIPGRVEKIMPGKRGKRHD